MINSTVTFRMLSRVLRDYPTTAIDAEWYKKLLYWNAWAHYQNGGDNRLPDQNEFWADGSADPQSIGYRSWIHHTILGATNFTMIEDAMGLRPRSDAKIELDPIDIGWDHFTANNIRYRDRDLTVTWDEPGGTDHYGASVPDGYSVFLDGELAFTVDDLAHVVYDPATGEVEVEGDATVTSATDAAVQAPEDVRFADDARVVDLFAKAGADVSTASTGSKNLAAGGQASATFSANGRTPAAAVNGTTINEPFWGSAGSPNPKDTLDGRARRRADLRRRAGVLLRQLVERDGCGVPRPLALHARGAQERRMVADPAAGSHAGLPAREPQPRAVPRGHRRRRAGHRDARSGREDRHQGAAGLQHGRGCPASTNQAPLVTAWQDVAASTAGEAALVGTAKDDGLPAGDLEVDWSIVSAPEGATVLFDDPHAASTVARFSTRARTCCG